VKLENLTSILEFLNFLDEKRLSYRIEHVIADCLTIKIVVPGVRYEVYFYEDRVDYSFFKGDEMVHDDLPNLLKELSEI